MIEQRRNGSGPLGRPWRATGETELGGQLVKVRSHRVIDQYKPYDSAAYESIPFAALKVPEEFLHTAIEFYDLIMENDHLTALLGCRGNYDIAIQMDEMTGTMTGWHWCK